jgi:cytidylate kinase
VSVDSIVSYLKAAAIDVPRRTRSEPPAPFVTLSREAGCGGGRIAEAIAGRLSRSDSAPWRVLDHALCEQVACDPKLTVSIDRLVRESYRGSLEESIARLLVDDSPQLAVLHKVFRLVRASAAAGRVVVVGRAGSLVTRGLEGGIHVRVVLDRARRVSNLERRLRLAPREADRECERRDSARRLMVKDLFRKDIEDPHLYDAVINAGQVQDDDIAELLAVLASRRRRVAAAS